MFGSCFRWRKGQPPTIMVMALLGALSVMVHAASATEVGVSPAEEQVQEQQRILGSARKALEMRFHLLDQSRAMLSDHVDNHKLVPQDAAARLVGIYEAMRPREAAAVFDVMDPHVLIAIATSMNIRKLSGIMAHMTPDRVNMVSQYLVGVRHFHHAVLSVPVLLNGTGVILPSGQEGASDSGTLQQVHYETMSQHGPLLPSRQ